MPNDSSSTKPQSNKRTQFWLAALILSTIIGIGLFFWVASQKKELKNKLENRESSIQQLNQFNHQLRALNQIDHLVILEGEYVKATEQYKALKELLPDSIHKEIELRISELNEMVANRSGNNGPDPKELLVNKYRKELASVKSANDSLNSALVAQSGSLHEKITDLESEVRRLKKSLQQKERVDVISFQSINSEKIQYLGEVENGKANGGGVGIWSTGSVYRGDWKNNRRHGQGTFEWADGEVYKGTFIEGRREGQGKYYWPSGERYEGEWVNNRRNGQGKLFDMDGNIRYEGKWKDDKPVEK